LWPILQWVLRFAIQRLVRSKVSQSSLDYAGVLVLLLEIITSTPQFFVLTMCVAACAMQLALALWRTVN
jgi:hypothetical protein